MLKTGILADGRKHVVEGSKKAKKADLDFELSLDKDLACGRNPNFGRRDTRTGRQI